MNEVLKTLAPEKVWHYFAEILGIPRPSKKEEKILAYLLEFGAKKNLETLQDATGNILIRKPATAGYENRKGVVLQSHVDMVCEKNNDTVFDFEKDPIQVEIVDGWIRAKGTTLGGDNGIGVATQLAILDSENIEHGPLECLFTIDEETGLTGANGLEKGFLQGEILLNLDSEDDGQFFIGCAGGIDTVINWKYTLHDAPAGTIAFRLTVKGLSGGHSGDDINKGRENAIKLLNRMLFEGWKSYALSLAYIAGGNLRNAIPREAYADLLLPADKASAFAAYVSDFTRVAKKELPQTEPQLQIELTPVDPLTQVFSPQDTGKLLHALYAAPHGVIRMASDIPNFVETSTNLAAIRMKDGVLQITTSQRSSVESRKQEVAQMVASAFLPLGAEIRHGEGYPGWTPNTQSPILQVILDAFRKRFSQEGQALAIHAGLECGLISEKYPQMDMVSYGPTMRGVHSPDERMELVTVERFWDLTLDVLKEIPPKK